MPWLTPEEICYIRATEALYIAMSTLKSSQSATAVSTPARNALENREDFNLWAEAVKQQMLEALQKRQRG